MKNELLPTIKKDSIFIKIKKFFMKLFGKEESFEEDNFKNNTIIIEEKNKFVKTIKLLQNESNTNQNNNEKDELIKQLENDTSLLENLSIDRLEKLNNYYDELIEKEQMKLKKLTSKAN